MGPKRSSSNVRVLRSASKPRAVFPPSPKCPSSAVGVCGKSGSPKEDRGKAPAATIPVSPNFLEFPEPNRSSSKVYNLLSAPKPPAVYLPQKKRRPSVVASGGKPGYPKDDRGKAPATGSPSRCRPNSAPSKEVGNLSGGGGRGSPPLCTAAKTPAQPETFSFDKIDVPNEAWLWNDPLDPWIDAVRDEEIFSHFHFKCFPGSPFEKYVKELEEARAAEMSKNGKKVVDRPKAWFWTDPGLDDEWEEETEEFAGSGVVTL